MIYSRHVIGNGILRMLLYVSEIIFTFHNKSNHHTSKDKQNGKKDKIKRTSLFVCSVMNRKVKQWWLTTLQISTKRPSTYSFYSFDGNRCPYLEQVKKCGGEEPITVVVFWIRIFSLLNNHGLICIPFVAPDTGITLWLFSVLKIA